MVRCDARCSIFTDITHRVRNILDGTSSETILHTCPSFLILPDMKWDHSSTPLTALYLLAIVRDPSIRSMRDLRSGHIPLLKEIRDAAHTVVEQTYGLKKGRVRLYVHYQPSYCRSTRRRGCVRANELFQTISTYILCMLPRAVYWA